MDDPGGQRLGLAPIQLANKTTFDSAFASLAEPLSDYSFACNYIWGACLKLYWLHTDNHLCVFANGAGDLTLLVPPIPLAGADEADLRDCLGRTFDLMDAYNDVHADRGQSRIEYVSDEMLERIGAATLRGGPNLSATPMSGDYIYDMARMIDLAGGPLKSKRHARSKFLRDHPDARVTLYDPSWQAGCEALLDCWQHHGDETHVGETNEACVGSHELRRRDTLASRRALNDYAALGLTGMVLLVGERVIGFTFGEALSGRQASVLIEKTHHDYDGAAQFIFSEFCRLHWSHLPECNAGDDWGLPKLRFTKQSYRPVRVLNKSVLTRVSLPLILGYAPTPEAITPEAFTPEAITPEGFAPEMLASELSSDRATLAGVSPLPQGEAASADGGDRRLVFDVALASASGLGDLESQGHTPPASGDGAGDAGDGLLVEPAMASDLPAILALEDTCFDCPQERFCRRQVRSLLHNPRATVVVARWQGQVVGWTSTLVRRDKLGMTGRIYAIAVRPSLQGRGIGRRLLAYALNRLGQWQVRRIVLEVRQGNSPAMTLYERMGFGQPQFLPDYYGPGRHGWRLSHAPLPSAVEAAMSPRSADALGHFPLPLD